MGGCCSKSNSEKDDFNAFEFDGLKEELKKISSKGFQMPIQWGYSADEKGFIPLKEMHFSYDTCKFLAIGNDSEGEFAVTGMIEKQGEVTIEQIYRAKGRKKFKGKFDENVLNGEWENSGKEGKFTLEFISKVWRSDKHFVALKSLQEPVGIAKFDYGFGIVHGTPSAENSMSLIVTFNDGKTGGLKCTLQEDKMRVEVEVSNKKQILQLKAKDESE